MGEDRRTTDDRSEHPWTGFRCLACGKDLPMPAGRGRPRLYCNDACRMAANRAREAGLPNAAVETRARRREANRVIRRTEAITRNLAGTATELDELGRRWDESMGKNRAQALAKELRTTLKRHSLGTMNRTRADRGQD